MSEEVVHRFEDVLLGIQSQPSTAWVYLPIEKNWTLKSSSAVLGSDETTEAQQDDPEAGVPQFAKLNKLIRVLPVTVVQDIVENARAQRPNATIQDLFQAFKYYYDHDAFIRL